MTIKKEPAVILVSGGLDSAVTLACAIRDGFEAHALTIRYGQRHEVEIESAASVCEQADVSVHRVLELDLSGFGGSALTSGEGIPKNPSLGTPGHIPSTYVPARNTVFLSLAVAWAEALGARRVYIGVSSVDYSGYPDCRPAFIESFEETVNLGTRAADGGPRIQVCTPIIDLTKGETVELGLSLGVDFGNTWSCYDPGPNRLPCGVCDSCRLRKKGFQDAGVEDPLLVGTR